MSLKLIVQKGDQILQTKRLKRKVIIGRSSTCDLQLIDDEISRRHLKIFLKNKELFFENLGSSNGVYINGEYSIGEGLLTPRKDVLSVGKYKIQIEQEER